MIIKNLFFMLFFIMLAIFFSSNRVRKTAFDSLIQLRSLSTSQPHPSSSIPVSFPSISPLETTIIRRYALDILDQHKRVLLMLRDNDDYVRRNEQIFNSSIAAHTRHNLDHFRKLLDPFQYKQKDYNNEEETLPLVDYDTRVRDSPIELDMKEALNEIHRLVNLVDGVNLNKNLSIKFATLFREKEMSSFQVTSYVGRELAFVSHHAIHHLASIKLILATLDYIDKNSIKDIGIAPSTLIDQIRTEK